MMRIGAFYQTFPPPFLRLPPPLPYRKFLPPHPLFRWCYPMPSSATSLHAAGNLGVVGVFVRVAVLFHFRVPVNRVVQQETCVSASVFFWTASLGTFFFWFYSQQALCFPPLGQSTPHLFSFLLRSSLFFLIGFRTKNPTM